MSSTSGLSSENYCREIAPTEKKYNELVSEKKHFMIFGLVSFLFVAGFVILATLLNSHKTTLAFQGALIGGTLGVTFLLLITPVLLTWKSQKEIEQQVAEEQEIADAEADSVTNLLFHQER